MLYAVEIERRYRTNAKHLRRNPVSGQDKEILYRTVPLSKERVCKDGAT